MTSKSFLDTQVNFDGLLNKGGHILFERAKSAMQEDPTSAKENFKKAIRFYTLAYQERKKRIPNNPNVGNPLYNLANCYVKLYLITNDFEYLIYAEKGFRKAIKIRRDNGDFNSINLSQMNGNLGECLGFQDRITEALPLLLANIEKHIDTVGYDDADTYSAIKMFNKAGKKCEKAEEVETYVKSLLDNFDPKVLEELSQK